MRVVDLRQKEVINICTCKTLGCPIDVEFNPKTGHLTGLVLPGPVKFCGFFCHGEDFVIPWDRICQIGINALCSAGTICQSFDLRDISPYSV